VDRRERERLLREGGVHDGNPLARARDERLREDLEESPLRGKPLSRRLRNFRPDVADYVVALGGPRPYMQRLRDIEHLEERHERELAAAYDDLARDAREAAEFACRWRGLAERWRFDEINALIERHNRFFPIEARLPMDPRTGDFVRLAGESYRRARLDADWILARFPAELPA
jgi:hypothetical protein